ncbi:uncharacterized protein LOC134355783 isoform X1 [Mobula hypostoma]|uniref:uncharacterized protein LOC134355783 isoform X1 n=1 Tax=Mobula hypostoma TaxID=723540 RepID=UPI002FC3A841
MLKSVSSQQSEFSSYFTCKEFVRTSSHVRTGLHQVLRFPSTVQRRTGGMEGHPFSTEKRRNFFGPRVVNLWNSLPLTAVEPRSLGLFKADAGGRHRSTRTRTARLGNSFFSRAVRLIVLCHHQGLVTMAVLKSRKHLVNFPELFQTHRPRACFYSVLGMIRTDRAGLTKRELRSGMQCSADSAGTSHRDLAKVDRHKWSTQYGESRTLLKRAAAGDSSKFKSKFIMEMDKQPKCKRQRGGGRRRWRCDAARAAVPNDIICVN